MAFTEFYCQTTGSNLNAGSTTADAAVFTFTNGGLVGATGVFTAAGANLSGVSVGMFASIYLDGATVAVFVARITAVDDTLDTITVSLTAVSGTIPADGATGRTIKVGGAWKGPNGAVDWPLDTVTNALTNAAGDSPRMNLKNDGTYSTTSQIIVSTVGPIDIEGYTSTPGDGGKATIDAGTSNIVIMSVGNTADNIRVANLILKIASTSGTTSGVTTGNSHTNTVFEGIVVTGPRNSGFLTGSGNTGELYIECEAYGCNTANASTHGGFQNNGSNTFIRCISHDNSGSNNVGFRSSVASGVFEDCIADTNGAGGFSLGNSAVLRGCESYNNGGSGIVINNAAGQVVWIENCNLVKNGGYGIVGSGAGSLNGRVINCGFGSGTQANTSGQTTGLKSMIETGSVTYAADTTPWVDPANGDFRIREFTAAEILAGHTARGAGRGTFTQTASGYAGTAGYPSIGAAQPLEVAGVGGAADLINGGLVS